MNHLLTHPPLWLPRTIGLLLFLASIPSPVRGELVKWAPIEGHRWIGEPWEAGATVTHGLFHGRQCLELQTQNTAGAYALIRTDRFRLETWRPDAVSLKVDVYNPGPTSPSLKLEVRGEAFDSPIPYVVTSGPLATGGWVTYEFSLAGLGHDVGFVSFVLDNLLPLITTVYVDNLRLVLPSGQEIPWDSMNGTREWFAFGNWHDFSGIPPGAGGFPGIDFVSSMVGAPGSETAAVGVGWEYTGGPETRAEIGTMTHSLDLSSCNRVRFWARTPNSILPVGVFFWDGISGFSPPSVFLPRPNEWFLVTLDLPWPAFFNYTSVEEIKFFVDAIDAVPIGEAWFDEISFENADNDIIAEGLHFKIEDFEEYEMGVNRIGGNSAAFAVPQAAEPADGGFLDGAEGSRFSRRIVFNPGYEFVGYFSSLHGLVDDRSFTFDARRFDALRFWVRSGNPTTNHVNLQVELKDAFPADAFFHTAYRVIGVDLPPGTWQRVTIPLDVGNRAVWTHNQHPPDPASLKELTFVVVNHFNAPNGAVDIDCVELIDTDAVPLSPSVSDADFKRHLLRDTLSFFLNEYHPETGLWLDRESFSDLATIAGTGFGIALLDVMRREGMLTRDEAAERAMLTLSTLLNCPMGYSGTGQLVPSEGQCGVDGFFYHFLDAKTGLRKVSPGSVPPEVSSVDTAIFILGSKACAGAMTVSNGYTAAQQTAIRTMADQIAARVQWSDWLDPLNDRMILGWKPEPSDGYQMPFRDGYASGSGISFATWDYQTDEVLLIALAGMAAQDPAKRLPVSFMESWQRVQGSFRGKSHIQSFFGAAFTHQFASLFFPLDDLPPDSMGLDQFENNKSAHLANLEFCRHPDIRSAFPSTFDGVSALLTANEDPDKRYGGAHGAPPNGSVNGDGMATDAQQITAALLPNLGPGDRPEPDRVNGVLAPYGAGSAFYFIPDEACAILRHYYFDLGLGEPLRGLPDAFTLSASEFLAQETELAVQNLEEYDRLMTIGNRPTIQHVQFAIDQGPFAISLANHLDDGVVQFGVMQDPGIRAALTQAFPGFLAGGPPPTLTRIINLTGNLNFGSKPVGSNGSRKLTIWNSGNSGLTVKRIKLPRGYRGNWSGTIAPGGKKRVNITFSPTARKKYNGKVRVISNAGGGVKTRRISGQGQ